jgi:HemY protein
MRLLIISLLGLLVAIVLGMMLSRDMGLMIFSYAGYNIQTSVSFFVVALVLSFFAAYFVFRLVGSLFRLSRSIDRWSNHRRNRRSERHLCEGILAMLEGDWRTAEESFHHGARDSRMPLVNYLAAAQAAQHLGAITRRDTYLSLAHENGPEAALAVGLTQAKLQLTQNQTEQAYATLKHLAPDQDQVKVLLLEAAIELKEWPEALRLLVDRKNKKILPADQLRQRQIEVYKGLLIDTSAERDRSVLEAQWDSMPCKLKENTALIEEYVQARMLFGDVDDCEQLLRKAIKREWDPRLVRQYGLLQSSNLNGQLQFVEGLLSSHVNDAELLLTLGRLCKRNSLWGKAKSYLHESVASQASVEGYQELALLLKQQGEDEAAGAHFQLGLALATGIEEHDDVALLEAPNNDHSIVAGARSTV